MWPALDDHIFTAACAFVRRPLVHIVPVRRGEHARDIYSGSVIRTPSGHPVILTVKHLFEHEWEVISAGYTGGEHLVEDIVQERFYLPGDFTTEPDVAVILLKEHARTVFDAVAVDWSSVTTNADVDFDPAKRFAILTGYPWAYVSHTLNRATKTGVQMLGSVASQAIVTGRDRDRFVLDWHEATIQDVNADHPVARGTAADAVAQASVGDNVRLPPPNGMSGGSLWAFEPVSGGFWYPSLTGRLIGIQASWNRDRTLFVESPQRYGAWLVKTMREIDKQLGGNIGYGA